MPFAQRFPALEDIPTDQRAYYVEREGQWVLDVDPPIEDVTGLKSALDSERRLRREADRKVTDLTTRYEGIDPEEVTTLRTRIKDFDDAEIYNKDGIDSLVARRTESMKSDYERQLRQRDNEIGQLKETNHDLDHRWRHDRITTRLTEAVVDAGVDDLAIPDAVQRGLAVFTSLDDHGDPVARTGSGRDADSIVYGKDGINPLSPKEWYLDLRASGKAAHLWPRSSGGGAPVHHTGPGAGVDWSALSPTERMTKMRELEQRPSRAS